MRAPRPSPVAFTAAPAHRGTGRALAAMCALEAPGRTGSARPERMSQEGALLHPCRRGVRLAPERHQASVLCLATSGLQSAPPLSCHLSGPTAPAFGSVSISLSLFLK